MLIGTSTWPLGVSMAEILARKPHDENFNRDFIREAKDGTQMKYIQVWHVKYSRRSFVCNG